MNLIDKINKKQIKPDVPEFRVGDTVRVDVWIKEGKKERIQIYRKKLIIKPRLRFFLLALFGIIFLW